jgi:hypothetical protein
MHVTHEKHVPQSKAASVGYNDSNNAGRIRKGVQAALGGVAGGGKGAAIGAIGGGAAGLVYDRVTRNR